MIRRIVNFSLDNRLLVIIGWLLAVAVGVHSITGGLLSPRSSFWNSMSSLIP